jgi:hypothetical protein
MNYDLDGIVSPWSGAATFQLHDFIFSAYSRFAPSFCIYIGDGFQTLPSTGRKMSPLEALFEILGKCTSGLHHVEVRL